MKIIKSLLIVLFVLLISMSSYGFIRPSAPEAKPQIEQKQEDKKFATVEEEKIFVFKTLMWEIRDFIVDADFSTKEVGIPNMMKIKEILMKYGYAKTKGSFYVEHSKAILSVGFDSQTDPGFGFYLTYDIKIVKENPDVTIPEVKRDWKGSPNFVWKDPDLRNSYKTMPVIPLFPNWHGWGFSQSYITII